MQIHTVYQTQSLEIGESVEGWMISTEMALYRHRENVMVCISNGVSSKYVYQVSRRSLRNESWEILPCERFDAQQIVVRNYFVASWRTSTAGIITRVA